MALLSVKVTAKREEAVDICSFDLVSADGESLPAFEPGAHIDVHVPGGLVRQYSLWNDPCGQVGLYRIGVLKDATGRGGSVAMHEKVVPGTVLQIGKPRNQFALVDTPGHSLLFAGGIGITPILCMAQTLASRDARFELHYCTRSASRTAFREQLSASSLSGQVHLHHDDAAPEQRIDIESLLRAQAADCHLYVCGPKGFMDAVLSVARQLDWAQDRLHYEFFAPVSVVGDGDTPFEVKLAASGRVIPVNPMQTVLQALNAAGVELPTSCEQGICGTCVTRVLEGIPDHRDSFLMPEEQAANDCFTPCCSRSRTPLLVLDL
ncbi:PDR/VanB family oxidoreductase [Variovorax saccharolyticus]|uniref:PDR/VanB family oxidoreductase n=1 Tax=Variovorax saccharolyticus TaxID=3053516 RepID=UPI0025774478|nr:PDR/VanB family oxidoreductase [Variovorax sp. J31P216]MDM0028376.1 PDR/VanB family oxidoreductase [Variovorax sp. J31P216]